jgi:MFS family permease
MIFKPDMWPSVRWQIHVLFAIQLTSMGAMEMSGPFWPVHLRSLATSDSQFIFASIAVYIGPMLGIMLTSTFWGRLGDRYGHKAMMMRALFGLAATQFALAYANDVSAILALRFLQGACAGFIAPAQAYGVSIEAPARRAKLFAYLQVSTNLGSLAGAVIGGVILDHAAFFWINFSAALMCLACLAAVWQILPAVAPQYAKIDAKAQKTALSADARTRSVLKSPQILSLLVILGLLLLSRMVTQSPFSIYMLSIFQVENWLVGFCYGLLALGFVVSASLWARYFEGRNRQAVLTRLSLVIAGCILVTVLAGLTRSIAVFASLYFAWGVLLGATTPVLTTLISRATPHDRQGHILGFTQSLSQFSSIGGIAIGGWFAQVAGFSNLYFLVAVFYALGLAVTLLARAKAAITDPGQEAIHDR